ncbi:MAG: protein meaA [Hyphomonadaceae bacterium]|nr:protein meaA [Hyphomonadaceae bacterium]
MPESRFQHPPDPPWIFRTYAGHSTPADSNRLYRSNLAKGQTGLSVAFDLPTQTGYDSDHTLARGEVGKVGVPIGHLGDMRALFDQIPLERMNTSMTINAPAAWLIALYVACAEEQGADVAKLQGTTQNDIIKEYLSRGTYIFPPKPSLKLTADTISWCLGAMPKWNPINVCSYHLQEAGATPEQELAYALAAAIAVLDEVKARGAVPEKDFPLVFSRLSFFVNAGIRFVTELCKMRAFTELWDELGRDRYNVLDEKARRFRYGVQVNSLGLTEPQAENNVYRILIEMLAVTLSKGARARAVQLPAWNEALGLPRPWDQQWSLRMQQVLAYETDLLEYEDLFEGSHVVAAKVAELKAGVMTELARIEALGGAIAAVESGDLKERLVDSNRKRARAVETGELPVVGVNRFTQGEPSPLSAGESSVMSVEFRVEAEAVGRLKAWRAQRNDADVKKALAALESDARADANIMPATLACAKAGITTGEWAQALRNVFGEYRAPTGVALVIEASEAEDDEKVRKDVVRVSEKLGRTLTILVGKPGLDGHSNGAEQIAARARSLGMNAIYEGIRLTPAQIVAAAKEHKVHAVGLSILSGSHLDLVRDVVQMLRAEGIGVPVFVGGIIPPADGQALTQMGVAGIYTPKDYKITEIMGDIVKTVEARAVTQAR